ncbi:MAG: apiosidase-like domain-containing protein [Planctomycetota bacterium]|jgi:hypothetical protein
MNKKTVFLLVIQIAVSFGCADYDRTLQDSDQFTAEQWRIAEIVLNSSVPYDDPYNDCSLVATFRGPGSRMITRPGFWDGGDTWAVRFAPTIIGTWSYTITCSDPNNTGLHNKTGTVGCVPYSGNNPNYKHGFLKVSANKTHFRYSDGTPFYWLGDTHWQMPDRENTLACNHPAHGGGACPYGGQFQHIVQDRIKKGFTVYQTYPNPFNSHWWQTASTNIRLIRFQNEFDYMMDYLADRGFVISLGVGQHSASKWIPNADLVKWGKYISARYGAHPIVWLTGQEVNPSGDEMILDNWENIAIGLVDSDGYAHPLGGHIWPGNMIPYTIWGDRTWHSWFPTQGGHNRVCPKSYFKTYWDYGKVFLETEANYESIDWGGVVDTKETRMSAWKSTLCGSLGGYTYGAAGIWLLKWDPNDPRKSNLQVDGWYQAMALPGSEQMTHMKNLYTSIEWWKLKPRWNSSIWANFSYPEESAISTIDNDLYLVYLYRSSTAAGTLKNMDSEKTYTAKWFNVQTGKYTTITSSISGTSSWTIPSKPDVEDWVLIMGTDVALNPPPFDVNGEWKPDNRS